jgi:ATP-dependent DNA helicase PIF1
MHLCSIHVLDRIYCIDGPVGIGKIYVENLLLKSICACKQIVFAIASSWIASLLLKKGRTAHSRFKIQISIDSTSMCSIQRSDLAELLQQTKLIIWDKAPMTDKLAFEALDCTLEDIKNMNMRYGGITTVNSGDFRQVL